VVKAARSSTPLTVVVATAALLAVVAYGAWSDRQAPADQPAAARPTATAARPTSAPVTPPAARPDTTATAPARDVSTPPQSGVVMHGQRIFDEQGRLVYEGDVDLAPVFARLAAGGRDSHRNDGTVFGNREGRLPRQPRGYYTEWVVRTQGLRGAGPQRLITGQQGEAYYTPDHYETFVPVRRPPS
jgi:filamentous hemagglutinin